RASAANLFTSPAGQRNTVEHGVFRFLPRKSEIPASHQTAPAGRFRSGETTPPPRNGTSPEEQRGAGQTPPDSATPNERPGPTAQKRSWRTAKARFRAIGELLVAR